jgi:hypothetical protein
VRAALGHDLYWWKLGVRRYVSVGDADVAYQVLGQAPADLLALMPLGNNVDLMWTVPEIASVVVA